MLLGYKIEDTYFQKKFGDFVEKKYLKRMNWAFCLIFNSIKISPKEYYHR